ncbi:glycosyltransferase family 2 protein [Microcoleus sp. FACHB-1515]|uniref:glycosyltransferase family 2 protein n=1 Tax=Cyanophyceae TaxID=3028117 RepID=UPI0016887A21|nr:glycosyltransferase family 2 protein [Microcoleus sp. FACHB-1515]MBD2092244.1 glycosyltransferase family 2 protein [Microcoleus sp. FACHB-1515]
MTLISAIVCTHNRDRYLGGAIDSLLTQNFAGEFEAIVVDNASIDRTRAVVESRLPHPHLRYVYEPQLGLSIARNTAAKHASSPILAYLDDDAIASPHWLQMLYDAFVLHPDLAIAGGRVTLLWPDGMTRPRWLSAGLMQSLGAYDLGAECVWIDRPGQTPRGLNYAIRKSTLESIGGFDVNLGRRGKNLLSNEELYATEQVLQRSGRVAYLPQAQVAHQVAPERLRASWFLSRNWWQGISDCYREQAAQIDRRQQLQQGSDRLLRGCVKAIRHLHQPAICFDNLVYAYGQIAYLKACLQQRSGK